MRISTRSTWLAVSAGAISASILFAVEALQALAVGADLLHGALGLAITWLTWPALVLAVLPLLRLGRLLQRDAGAAGVGEAWGAGALAGVLAGVGYTLGSLVLLVAVQRQPLSSNPGLIPAFAPTTIGLVLLVGLVLGALVTVLGTRVPERRVSQARNAAASVHETGSR